MEPRSDTPRGPLPDDDAVPIFRTWTRIYAAVVVSAVVVMALVALFSAWNY